MYQYIIVRCRLAYYEPLIHFQTDLAATYPLAWISPRHYTRSSDGCQTLLWNWTSHFSICERSSCNTVIYFFSSFWLYSQSLFSNLSKVSNKSLSKYVISIRGSFFNISTAIGKRNLRPVFWRIKHLISSFDRMFMGFYLALWQVVTT